MKVFITTPNLEAVHGGTRIIHHWANKLADYHDVYLHCLKGHKRCSWMRIDQRVKICGFDEFYNSNIVILTSPHSAPILDLILPHQQCFIFLQMDELLFKPGDISWAQSCIKMYQSKEKTIVISEWIKNKLTEYYGKPGNKNISIIPNGIDFNEFPLQKTNKDFKTVLIESFESTNPTKDPEFITAKVAARLKKDGYKIIGFGAKRPAKYSSLCHEFYVNPSITKLNELYSRATILLKSTVFDCRSLSPLEAMTKGTPTVRQIYMGDDDLTDQNCYLIRGHQSEIALYNLAIHALTDREKHETIANNAFSYVSVNCNWETIIPQINKIISCQEC